MYGLELGLGLVSHVFDQQITPISGLAPLDF